MFLMMVFVWTLISKMIYVFCRGIQPYKMYEQFVMLWETPFLRPYLKVVAYLLKHLKGLGKHTTDKVITSFKVIRGMDFDSVSKNYH